VQNDTSKPCFASMVEALHLNWVHALPFKRILNLIAPCGIFRILGIKASAYSVLHEKSLGSLIPTCFLTPCYLFYLASQNALSYE